MLATFVVLLKWTGQGIKNYKDSPSRADAFTGEMERLGGKRDLLDPRSVRRRRRGRGA